MYTTPNNWYSIPGYRNISRWNTIKFRINNNNILPAPAPAPGPSPSPAPAPGPSPAPAPAPAPIPTSNDYSIFPTSLRNDGVSSSPNSIVIFYSPRFSSIESDLIIEIKRKYICTTTHFCSYNLDLVNDENDINKRKIKYFNFDFFSSNENPFFEITYIAKEELINNFHTYRYHMNDSNEHTRFISILENKVTNSNGQVTKKTLGGKIIYNITFPNNDFIIPSTHIPFKFIATSSQKMHHVVTVDEKDLIFYISEFSQEPPTTDDPPSEQMRIRNVEPQPVDKYNVTINRPIEIFHDVRGTTYRYQQYQDDIENYLRIEWSGYILVTIDVNWNITMKFVTGDGWSPNSHWIYGRLWVASGNDNVESDAMLPDETIYNETFTNPNDNNRGYTGAVVTTHQLKAFRNTNEDQKIVVVQINKNSNTKTKAFNNDPNNNNPHYIRDGDEIYVLRYQGRLEGYYDGERQINPPSTTLPEYTSIDISGDIKLKLPNNFKTGSGYNFFTF